MKLIDTGLIETRHGKIGQLCAFEDDGRVFHANYHPDSTARNKEYAIKVLNFLRAGLTIEEIENND